MLASMAMALLVVVDSRCGGGSNNSGVVVGDSNGMVCW